MNFDEKDKMKQYMKDNMNLKSHLNNSLEDSGIQVTEDLIQRTLQAVKQSELENHKTQPMMIKQKPAVWIRYSKGFATVAAAALLLVVGYQFGNYYGTEAKNSSFDQASEEKVEIGYLAKDLNQESQYDAKITTDEAENKLTSEDASGNKQNIAKEESKDDTMGFASIDSDSGNQGTDNDMLQDNNTADSVVDSGQSITSPSNPNQTVASSIYPMEKQTVVSFAEIVPLNLENIDTIIISDVQTGSKVTLNEDQKLDFYNTLYNYMYTQYTLKTIGEDYRIEFDGTNVIGVTLNIVLGGEIDTYTEEEIASLTPEEKANRDEIQGVLHSLYQKYFE